MDRDLLVAADSLCSLILHRESGGLSDHGRSGISDSVTCTSPSA
jgi:hypothetical protein